MSQSEDIRDYQRELGEKDRLLSAFQEIGRAVLSAESIDEVLDTLVVQVADAALFRSLSVCLVDPETRRVRLVRMTSPRPGGGFTVRRPDEFAAVELSPDSTDISAEVARLGKRVIIEGWDQRFQSGPSGSRLLDPNHYADKVSYFIPVLRGDRVLAVLGTGSTVAERKATEQRLDAMLPLLDQVAVAIEHVRIYEDLASHAARLDARVAASEHENLALLAINDLVLRMRIRDDLEAVVRGIFDQLTARGIDFRGMTIHRVTDESLDEVESHELRPTGEYRRHTRRNSGAVREWQDQVVLYRPDIEKDPQDLAPDYYATTYRGLGLRVASLLTVPYAHGTINFRSSKPGAFSADHITFVRKIAAVLSVGISRLSDLERADRARRQEVTLLGISQACLRIDTADDLGAVLTRTFDLLKACDLSFSELVLHRFLDSERGLFEVWHVEAGGASRRETIASQDDHARLVATTTRYRSEIEVTLQDSGEPGGNGVQEETNSRHIESIYEVSFDTGVLALVSDTPDSFSYDDTEFMKRVAGVLAIGIARIADFERVAQSENRYRSVVTALAEGIVLMNAEGSFIAANQRAEQILGLTEDQIFGRTIFDPAWGTIYEDGADFPPESHPIFRTLKTGQPCHNVIMGVRKPDSSLTWISINTEPLLTEGADRPTAAVASFADITDRLGVEKELRESKAFQDRLFDAMEDGFVVLDPDGVHLDCNRSFCELTGYNREELIGVGPPHPYWPDDLRGKFVKAGIEFLGGRESATELVYQTKDGRRVPVEITPSAIRDDGGQVRYYLATARDITDRRQMEEERIRSQRLRAIGELSAGISHNLNNILTGVIGPAEILRSGDHGEDVDDNVDTILKSALRAADIVRRLHRGTAGSHERRVAVDLNAVVRDAVRAARPRWMDQTQAIGVTIELDTHLEEVPSVSGTAAGLHDIILNLVFNAVDAMPEGGRIQITTARHAGGVRLEFTDTGVGMNEETRTRVFEPFFTTKQDVGTGLGLSTAYSTIAGWGGSIDLRTRPGTGTTFSIDLREHHEKGQDEPVQEIAEGGRRGSVLLVEDDEGVLSVLEAVLGADHELIVYRDGAEAAEADAETLDAAVIDLGLPSMPGNEVLARLRASNPAMGALLITGWHIEEGDNRAEGFDAVVQKPFRDLEWFRQTVHDLVKLHDSR